MTCECVPHFTLTPEFVHVFRMRWHYLYQTFTAARLTHAHTHSAQAGKVLRVFAAPPPPPPPPPLHPLSTQIVDNVLTSTAFLLLRFFVALRLTVAFMCTN